MMDKLRSRAGKGIWNVIFALISISFVLGGVGSYLVGRVDTSAAKVNGEEISQSVFQNALQQQIRSMGAQMGAQFSQLIDSPEFIMGLRKDVINNLVDEVLLNQFVNELGLAVSDDQIKRFIVTMPIFQKDGMFNNDIYQQFLKVNGISADQYAMSLRNSIIMSQLQQGLLSTETISKEKLKNLNEYLYQTRNVYLTELPLAGLEEQQQVSDKEITDYYNSHKSAFTVPEMVKVAYVDISKPDIEKNIKVSDVEIAQYYQDHKSELSQSREHLAHIQVATKEEADKLYQELKNGADFSILAQSFSTDKLSAVKGGDLSWSKPGIYPSVFEKVANATPVGQFSQPVDVDGLYHIIKVIDREDNTPPLEDVRSQIVDTIRNELATTDFYRVEKEASEKAFEDQASLEGVEQVVGEKAVVTGFFSRQDIPTALNFSNVTYNIFDTDLIQGGENSEAINVGDQHSIIVRVLEHKPAGTRSLDEVRGDIATLLKQEKAEQQLLSIAKELTVSLNKGDKPVLPNGITLSNKVEKFVYITAQDRTLRDEIFAIPLPKDNKPDFAVVSDSAGKVYLADLISVTQGNPDESQANNIAQVYLQNEQVQTYQRLIQALRDKAEIKINQEFIMQQE